MEERTLSISKRELAHLVNHAMANSDDATLVKVAEIVLGKRVLARGGRFSLKALENPEAVLSPKLDGANATAGRDGKLRSRRGGTPVTEKKEA